MQTSWGSTAPRETGEHVPSEVERAQLRQLPAQAVAQQTPSAQKLLAHSLLAEQGWPSILAPQLPFTQLCPDAQSLSLVHRLMHAPLAHPKGAQSSTPGGRHVPRPSQVPAVFSRPPLHDGTEQTVSGAYLVQPPTPSQTPVSPHVEASVFRQIARGSATPTAIAEQLPVRPLRLQLTQGPEQALLQQKPSTQYPDAH
jgi:hypothetical protein